MTICYDNKKKRELHSQNWNVPFFLRIDMFLLQICFIVLMLVSQVSKFEKCVNDIVDKE